MRLAFTVLVAATASMAGPAEAQILNVRPAPFADLRPGRQARHGEVVLGQTTLAGALRIFSEHLWSDSVKVPRGHGPNPSPWPAHGSVWVDADHEAHPRHYLDLGPERYGLYFDENRRLIGASTSRLPGGLTSKVLSKHYPSLRKNRRWYSGDKPLFDTWSVALSSCVTLVASVLIEAERVQNLSYYYTCPTTSTRASKTTAPR